MTKNKMFTLFLMIFTLALLGGCSEAPVRIGVFDRAKIAREKAVFGEVNALNAEIALLEELMRDKKDQLREELQEMEEEANESLKREWTEGMEEREEKLNNALNEKFKGFLAEKNQEMQDFIASVENEANKKLDEITKKAASPLLTEMQLADLEKEADEAKKQADEKIKAKDARIQKEINDTLADSRAAAKRNLDEYAVTLREKLTEERKKQLREFAEEQLGDDQKKQNDLLARREALQKSIDERINKAVEAAAKEKKLEIVLSQVFSNVKAVDITGDVMAILLKK
ncbi:MAG: OmpH family outer membrane protein [Acidaminococcales bacterium]|nr:OmpH family outer membrane protein [Acidaminococcales bacterium]